jgi:hypothetical protein
MRFWRKTMANVMDETRETQANRAILKLIAISRCMEIFEDREWAGDMTNGFKYIMEDATTEVIRAVFPQDE